MYLAKIGDLQVGDTVARDIYNTEGSILLPKGTNITLGYIKKLENLGINHIYIQKNFLDEEKVKKYKLVPDQVKREIIIEAKHCINSITSGNQRKMIDQVEAVTIALEKIIDQIKDNEYIFAYLKDVRILEDELFFHLVNVTIYSLVIGNRIGYNQRQLITLGKGAFLHDIGKIKISDKILKKPAKLTKQEFAEVKKHTVYGYDILRNQVNLSHSVSEIAKYHHERCDGSGYPERLTTKAISTNSKIVAIADVFDSMINDRVYREGIIVKEVVEYLYTMYTEEKLDRRLIEIFLEIITPYPIGTRVRLSIGCQGIVIKVNNNFKLRPVVRVLSYKQLNLPRTIDLSERLDIEIIEVLE